MTVLISTVLGIFCGGSLVQLVLLTLDLKRVFTSVLFPRPDSPAKERVKLNLFILRQFGLNRVDVEIHNYLFEVVCLIM